MGLDPFLRVGAKECYQESISQGGGEWAAAVTLQQQAPVIEKQGEK